MVFRHPFIHRHSGVLLAAILSIVATIVFPTPPLVHAQANRNFNSTNNTNNAGIGGVIPVGFQQAVGGISIRSDGLIENAGVDTLGRLRAARARLIKKAPADLDAAASLRKGSLRGLEEAIEDSLKSGKPLAEEIVFLAGLQEIRYVFVYPEEKD